MADKVTVTVSSYGPDRTYLMMRYTDPTTGKRIARSAGTADMNEANRVAAAWQDVLNWNAGFDDTTGPVSLSRLEVGFVFNPNELSPLIRAVAEEVVTQRQQQFPDDNRLCYMEPGDADMNKRIWVFQYKRDVAKLGAKTSWYVGWYDLDGKRHAESCGPGVDGRNEARRRKTVLKKGMRDDERDNERDVSASGCGCISRDELVTLAELKRRLNWEHYNVRIAKERGLRIIKFGCNKYVLGSDLLAFFEKLEREQDTMIKPATSRENRHAVNALATRSQLSQLQGHLNQRIEESEDV